MQTNSRSRSITFCLQPIVQNRERDEGCVKTVLADTIRNLFCIPHFQG